MSSQSTESGAMSAEARHDLHTFGDSLLGLPGRVIAATRGDRAFVACQGAQVLSWQGADGVERLYLSQETAGMRRGDNRNAPMAAIRGGMPVCFPQFSGRGALPKHGLVRTMLWHDADPNGYRHLSDEDGMPAVVLGLQDSPQSLATWPGRFQAMLAVYLGEDQLTVSLAVTNRGSTPWSFTGALHTYLRVDDIRQVSLSGLKGVRYQDATRDNALTVQDETELTIRGEVDRVYVSPPKSLRLCEGGVPRLRIEQHGFDDTVVWNPGPVKAAALPDMPDEDWQRMLCVEAACAAAPVTVQPGTTWTGSQTLTLIPA